MTSLTKTALSRRAALSMVGALTAGEAPVGAFADLPTALHKETARFLEWEREALFWYGVSSDGTPETDEELDAMMDHQARFQSLIAETPGFTLTAAAVKARQALRIFHQFNIEGHDAPDPATLGYYALLGSIVETLEWLLRASPAAKLGGGAGASP